MKHTIKILFVSVLFVNILVYAGANAIASDKEELIALWESEANSKIWGECVLSDIFSDDFAGKGKKFRLNALCHPDTYIRVKNLRKEAKKALENDIEDNSISDSTYIWKAILGAVTQVDIKSADEFEKSLMRKVCYGKVGFFMQITRFSDKDSSDDMLSGVKSVPGINISQNKRLTGKTTKAPCRVDADVRTNVNLLEYRLGLCKVDYFRLYLYLWEDSPWEGPGYIKRLPMLFDTSFQNTYISKIKKDSNYIHLIDCYYIAQSRLSVYYRSLYHSTMLHRGKKKFNREATL